MDLDFFIKEEKEAKKTISELYNYYITDTFPSSILFGIYKPEKNIKVSSETFGEIVPSHLKIEDPIIARYDSQIGTCYLDQGYNIPNDFKNSFIQNANKILLAIKEDPEVNINFTPSILFIENNSLPEKEVFSIQCNYLEFHLSFNLIKNSKKEVCYILFEGNRSFKFENLSEIIFSIVFAIISALKKENIDEEDFINQLLYFKEALSKNN